jgi:hypothetical protein
MWLHIPRYSLEQPALPETFSVALYSSAGALFRSAGTCLKTLPVQANTLDTSRHATYLDSDKQLADPGRSEGTNQGVRWH